MLDKAFVRLKLVQLVQHLDELEPLSRMTLAEYQADYIRRHAVEKLIELTVEEASDINRHLIESVGRAAPATYYSSFEALAKLKVITAKRASRLGATTGLRNRLVHGYEIVDHAIVHRTLPTLVRDYRQYIVAVEKYLTSVP